MSEYAELLKSPSWQRKRLEVLSRDNFTCQVCSDTLTTLHVHHKKYKRNCLPWEYDDSDLTTLCKHCHQVAEDLKKFGAVPVVAGKRFSPDDRSLILVSTVILSESGKHISLHGINTSNDHLTHIVNISESTLSTLTNLIQLSEKLKIDGKR